MTIDLTSGQLSRVNVLQRIEQSSPTSIDSDRANKLLVAPGEIALIFEGGVRGLAVDLGEEMIGCILLGDPSGISAGSIVHGMDEVAFVPGGDALLGRVVDALGITLDDGEPLVAEQFLPVEQSAPAIIDRALVTRPLATGLLVVDAMIPLGRGQRELIIGDRGTGKTAIASIPSSISAPPM